MNENLKLIEHARKNIAYLLMKESVNIKETCIKKISVSDLEILFQYYDEMFFGNFFKDDFKGKMKFSLSKRLSRSAGMTKFLKHAERLKQEEINIEIMIGVDFFLKYDELDRTKTVCGIQTHHSLEALQIVFEHELCHALEVIQFRNSSCKAKRFKEFAYKVFGHTQSHHQMPTNREIAKEKLGLSIGDQVSFKYENDRINGVISNINKRATVMVKTSHGQYIDKKGNRYSKYYVPLGVVEKK